MAVSDNYISWGEQMANPITRQKILDARREANLAWNKLRTGSPQWATRKQVHRIWAEARRKARKLIELMEEEGKFPEAAVVPGTDEEKAKKALEEVCAIGLAQGIAVKERLAALRTVLEFTKSKPETKAKVTLDKSEEWLAAVEADMKADAKRG